MAKLALIAICVLAVAAPWLPQSSGLLGSDRMGRDILSLLLSGARHSLWVGCVSVGLATMAGTLLGAVAGYTRATALRLRVGTALTAVVWLISIAFYGGYLQLWVAAGCVCAVAAGLGWLLNRFISFWHIPLPFDAGVQTLMAILSVVPSLLLCVAIAAVLPASTWSVILLLAGTQWVGVARLVRAEVLRVMQQPHVEAAHGLGIPAWRVLYRHVLPLALVPLWALLGLMIGNAILAESALSFLNIGVPDDIYTWGKMLASARSQHHGWRMAIAPGVAIFLTVWAVNTLSDDYAKRHARL